MIRDVEPVPLRDLLENPPRATVAFVDDGSVEVVPVRYHLRDDTHVFGVRGDVPAALEHGEVVLVLDDGGYWFELRGVSVRGVATRVDPVGGEDVGWSWYAIAARRVQAWDYGTIREV